MLFFSVPLIFVFFSFFFSILLSQRTLRCYNIAKLYYQVQDYESARRYVSCYLELKGDQAGPHKLLGEIYEALGQKESALAQYKQSLEIESRQDDLVLKGNAMGNQTGIGIFLSFASKFCNIPLYCYCYYYYY